MKDLKTSSNRYYPGCFEEGQRVDKNLKPGICLGPLLNILADSESRINPEAYLNS